MASEDIAYTGLVARLSHYVGLLSNQHGPRYAYYTTAILFLLLSLLIAELIALPASDLHTATLNACIISTNLNAITKGFLMLCKSHTYRSIAVRRLADFKDFANPVLDNPLLSAARRKLAMVLIIYLSIGSVPAFVWGTLPNEKGGNRILPLVQWIPFNATTSPQFEIVLLYQIIDVWFLFSFTVFYDLILIDVAIHICVQLRILGRNIKTIRSDDWEEAQKKEIDNGLNNADTERRQDTGSNVEISDSELSRRLKKCIHHHQTIIRLAEDLEECFNKGLCLQTLVSLVALCVSLCQIAVYAQTLHETAKYCSYLAAMFTQFTLVCYFGQELINESEGVKLACYNCSWPDCSLQFNRLLKVMMIRSQKALMLTAGKFTELSLETFLTVVNCSYSYYAVLRGMETD